MEPRLRKKISENQKQLKENINFEKLWPKLRESGIFSPDMLVDIENAGPTDEDKNNKLLNDLPKRGPEAFDKFVFCLVDSKQYAPARILNDVIPDAGPWQGTVVPATRFCGNDREKVYPMKSSPRGVALVISITEFQNNNLENREGGRIDEENLSRLFRYLGFVVDLHQNCPEMEIRQILQDFQKDPRHATADACIIVIMSHGSEKGFYSYDCNTIHNEYVLEMFNNRHCPLLHNKPKVFFLQHCRGDEIDHAIPFKEQTPYTDSNNVVDRGTLPTWSDMKICFSTSPNTLSMRSAESGTLFIAILAEVFSQRAHETHLDDLLEEVTDRMLQLEVYGWKQSPEYTARGWRGKLYFNPGLNVTPMEQ